jgi:hypothetical protein
MRVTVVATLLILATIFQAGAEEQERWVLVAETDSGMHYIDSKRANFKDSTKPSFWVKERLHEVQTHRGVRFDEAVTKWEFDCKNSAVRRTAQSLFLKEKLVNSLSSPNPELEPWQEIQPESIGEILFDHACGKD